MKRFLRKLLIFAVFTIVFYIIAILISGFILPSKVTKNLKYRIGSTGFLNTRLKELKTYGKVDVLILGSSRAYRGFDPRIFQQYGLRAFNLGSSAQTPLQTKILLKRYFELLDPDLVIFEVSPGNFSSDGIESAVDLIANDRNDTYTVQMALKLKNVKVFNTLIFGLFRDLLSLNNNFIEPGVRGDNKYISGGFVENKAKTDHTKKRFSPIITMREYQKEEFLEILDFMKTRDVDLMLARAPIARYRYDKVKNNKEIDNFFKNIGSYINCFDIIQLSDSLDFSDSHHLNQRGVEIFNHQFIQYIQTQTILKGN